MAIYSAIVSGAHVTVCSVSGDLYSGEVVHQNDKGIVVKGDNQVVSESRFYLWTGVESIRWKN